MRSRTESPATNRRLLPVLVAVAVLGGCGAETAGTAATGAAIKKQEVEEGLKTQQRAKEKIDKTMEQLDQRAQQAGGDK